MMEFEIDSRVQPIGKREGQTVYFDALKLGMSVDLAELGSFRLTVPSKMMDTPEEVTVADALKTPKITFTPKQKMRDAANSVELSIDRSSVKSSTGGGIGRPRNAMNKWWKAVK